ncbi:CQS_1a_G0039310.mRNA.1.CDS.1 [Saccharomyces cerevisiae]|nr:CQS_1a_G0039310.mRNA.1.CDS.1 [Saccharomyces cerevisiae]CAI5295087.1 ALI_HP2_G0039470.mRNA.1.CDS.1 [Saccharomyces cerevisiae]CAI6610408.1 ALI_HP2_G0039470.mRNA.1.CDS.1 [Saccharomyces cerevisiae]CAI6700606.1 ALI_HP1_G0041320.mRNA.1.CDS.1 [Saccharomyces cerevisiae]CAI6844948.1 ALI_collapsed_G0042700.mRNA.1.CDS.1 [Saccharomyces cerevisiae]
MVSKDQTSFNKRWTLGLLMLGLVIILWVLSSFLINLIFEDDSYRKPFFITYINTAAFIFYLFPTAKAVVVNYKDTGRANVHRELVMEEEGTGSDSNRSVDMTSPLLTNLEAGTHANQKKRLTLYETIKLSAEFCILWFTANLVTNASLAFTSVASQTILSTTSSFFTLFIGAICHVESLSKSKVLGSFISFVGIIMVTKSDSHQRYQRHIADVSGDDNDAVRVLIGNLLALAGAVLYGVYSTLLKREVGDETRVNMKIFFGFVGLFNLLFLWPSLIVLDFFGWEPFSLPKDPKVVVIIFVNCLITFVSDFCWAKAMLLTSPLTVTVGLSITIPLAMFGDVIFKHKTMSALYLFGATLILGSFFIINKSSEEEHFENSITASNYESVEVPAANNSS